MELITSHDKKKIMTVKQIVEIGTPRSMEGQLQLRVKLCLWDELKEGITDYVDSCAVSLALNRFLHLTQV